MTLLEQITSSIGSLDSNGVIHDHDTGAIIGHIERIPKEFVPDGKETAAIRAELEVRYSINAANRRRSAIAAQEIRYR